MNGINPDSMFWTSILITHEKHTTTTRERKKGNKFFCDAEYYHDAQIQQKINFTNNKFDKQKFNTIFIFLQLKLHCVHSVEALRDKLWLQSRTQADDLYNS